MNEKSVIAVIIVLLFLGKSFGNGNKRIEKTRQSLRKRYCQLLPYMNDREYQYSKTVVGQHLREMKDKDKNWLNWMQETSGYSPEQLSNPPVSMNVDVLTLATEYHLWQSGWYHVRFITLYEAAKRRRYVGDPYPSKYKCRAFAMKAAILSETHKIIYSNCLNALCEEAQQNIMKKIDFRKCLVFQEPNHEHPENESHLDPEWENHETAENDVVLSVKIHLERLIKSLLKRRWAMGSGNVRSFKAIQRFLRPSTWQLNEEIMAKLHDSFSVKDFSRPPDEASRNDGQFLEVAWLFNKYRSVWHEIRYIEFQNFFRHRKQDITDNTFERLQAASTFADERFHRYQSLYNDYFKVFIKLQADRVGSAQSTAAAADSIEVERHFHISANDSPEKSQWRGKHRRTTLKRVRNLVSQGNNHSTVVNYDSLLNARLGDAKTRLTNSMKRPTLDLNEPPPEIEEDMCLVNAPLKLHGNLDLCAKKNSEPSHDATDMDSIAPKRLKLTQSEENHSQLCPDLDSVHQSSPKKYTSGSSQTMEKLPSSSKAQIFDFL